MSPVELKGIDHSVQLTHIWINAVEARLGWDNKPRAWRLLKSVLHGVRDWLPTNEAADFGAQLPTYLRGVFYEGWRPATTPVTERGKKRFIDRIANGLGNGTRSLSGVVRTIQNGFVRSYALSVLLGVVIILGYLILR